LIRIVQIAHLTLIVVAAALYAWLMATLLTDDPWRIRITTIVAIAGAFWAALLFIETLRSVDQTTFKDRCIAAYRRLLTRLSTLVASTVVLALVILGLLFLGAGYSAVELSSEADQDVYMFLSNPGKEPQRIALIPSGKRIMVRLPIGRQWIYFESTKGHAVSYRTGKIDVLPFWRNHDPQTLVAPEVPNYVGQ
jgi:hypothetical protein